jgi:hypothetical protein
MGMLIYLQNIQKNCKFLKVHIWRQGFGTVSYSALRTSVRDTRKFLAMQLKRQNTLLTS